MRICVPQKHAHERTLGMPVRSVDPTGALAGAPVLPQAGLVLEVFAAIFAGALKSFLRHSPNFFKRLCAGCVPIFRLIRQLLESPLDRQRCTLFRKYTTNLVSIQIAVTTKCLSASAPPFCARFFKMLFAHVTVTLKRPGERFATQAAQDVLMGV